MQNSFWLICVVSNSRMDCSPRYSLRRAEVLFDLFQHDLRLWRAYITTLQSHPAFEEYLDLLNDLEEQLSSVTYLDGQRGSSTSSDRS
ncbi:RAB6A-GEF complex partner protein 1-like [Iris pallida]|uniref:RAB6A-GEF complex partner protein 1-like n=1 Tax=Iris pallida TaxID=29817 RepID=A0AAX6HJ02_IRIPA|nr:RAB6A-GEF complex partner protein 1-like [Iris pallida]